MSAPDPRRARDLARIHLAKKELGLNEETYRSLLKSTTGKDSASAMGPGERWKVLLQLGRMGAKSGAPAGSEGGKPYPGKPTMVPVEAVALISKIEALLADAKRPWAYAHAMAKRMFHQDQVQLCDPDELRRIVAALAYDAKRHGRDEG